MSKYSDVVYGGATYGATPRLNFSVEPMTTSVIRFDEAYVTWVTPAGFFTRIRLVRNQNGFPENQEDGVVIFETISPDGSSLEGNVRTSYRDGEENPGEVKILPGRNIFYSIFLYTVDNEWVRAGQITDVIPDNTGATEKIMNLLPRVLTTPELSPLGVIDPASDLYKFVDGLAFTYEQLMAQIKMIRPSHNTDYANSKTIEAEFLSLGLTEEPTLPTSNQRRLIREAVPSYQTKGTLLGVQNYAEALTAFAPVGTISPNLLLTVQDSTFYKTTGRWAHTSGVTLTATQELLPNIQSNTIDKTWTCKVVTTDSGSMTLGMDNYLLYGVPCLSLPYLPYTIGLMVKSPASSGTVTVVMHVYDPDDNTYTTHTSSPLAANNTWQQLTVTSVADADEIGSHSYVGIELIFSAAGTYYVDQVSVQQGPSYIYDEARALTLNLLPSKENYIQNPSFEQDLTGWELPGIVAPTFTRDTDVPIDGFPGSYSGKFVATDGWLITSDSHIPVESGTYFCSSLYIKSPDVTSVRLSLITLDADNNFIGSFTETKQVSNTWERVYVSGLINSNDFYNASYAIFSAGFDTGGTVYLDMVQSQNTFKPTDYFDGSLPASYGVIWQGTAHNSASLYYPGKANKIRRLAQTLNDWVPMNCWWRITTPAGLEYTVLDV